MREMKDSSIEWIGEIPVEWEIIKCKYTTDLYIGNSIKDEEKASYEDSTEAIPYIATKDIDVTFSTVDYENGLYVKNDDMTFSRANAGDTLMCIEGGSAGRKKAKLDRTVCFVNKLCCFHPVSIVPTFLYYLLNSPHYEEEFKINISGLIGGVSKNKLLNFSFPFPPLEEQHRISTYLDTKCEKIDSIIARQQEVIEKLKAYKLSVITEAVTKGLNPDVRMKDSGVEWIGDVPEHWEIHKFCWDYSASLGKMLDAKRVTGKHLHPYIKNSDVQWGIINITELDEMDFSDDEYDRYSVKPGDLMVCEGGEIGKCAIVPSDFPQGIFYQKALHRVRKRNNNGNIVFLSYVIFSMAKNNAFNSSPEKATIAHLPGEALSQLRLPTPPIEEQQQIADYLDKKCSAIDSAITKKQAIIEKLTAYKKSLIYEVVTGKREVNPKKEAITVICPVGIPTNEEEYARILLFQKIITMCGNHLKGRTHLMKIFHAIELGIGFSFNTEYTRHYHGPYDKHIENYENALVRKGWIKLKKGKNIEYKVTNSTAYKSDYKRIFGKYNKEIERIIDFFKSMKRTSKAEKVATLLASWNDFLIDGIAAPDDHMIISDVMNNWTENKSHIDYATWQEILNQMKKENIIPYGYCNHTIKAED